jgi:hypothetical protein
MAEVSRSSQLQPLAARSEWHRRSLDASLDVGDFFGVGFRAPLGSDSWPASAPFVAFSFVGLATTWRTRHHFATKLAFFLWHALAIALFITPILFFGWFTYQMRDH